MNQRNVNFQIDDQLYIAARKAAYEHYQSFSEYIREAIRDRLAREAKKCE